MERYIVKSFTCRTTQKYHEEWYGDQDVTAEITVDLVFSEDEHGASLTLEFHESDCDLEVTDESGNKLWLYEVP
ncbi:hypothetical protein HZC53_00760 [Candidatus Uhrbacteria bacterium]|nr:hypothetical protein [Candidatus Uhrbacteria bacterium]